MESISPKRVIVGALATVLSELPTLAKALLGPGLIYLTLAFYQPAEISTGIAVVLAAASLLLHTVFAITTPRIVMLGSGSIPEWGLRSWSRRETRFAGYVLALVFILSFLVAIAVATPPIGPIMLMILVVIGGPALSLIFPAVALEEEFTLLDAWRMAQGHLPALIICVGLFPTLLAMVTFSVSMIPYARPVAALLELVTTVLTIATLSLAFSEIRRSKPSG